MRLTSFGSGPHFDTIASNARGIMEGFQHFVDTHTNDTAEDGTGRVVINKKDVLLNNMHYEVALSGYMPNGTSTTEGQSLLIMGYIYAYKATGEKKWLALAERFWLAYLRQFYKNGDFVPEKPQVWRAHWAINGKAPFRTLGPVNYSETSESGAWNVPLIFNNGYAQMPYGQPYYCEKVARLFSVYSGVALWDSVTAEPEYPGFIVPFEYFVDDRHIRLAANGDSIDDEDVTTTEPIGRVKLAGAYANFTGTLNASFACRTGHIIGRNDAFEGWPFWRHVDKSEYGNSADSETWFCEASHLLYGLTGNRRYLNAFNSSFKTLWDSCLLADQTVFFQKTKLATTPFTEGISYWWKVLKHCDAYIGRDPNGYIHIEKTEELYDEDTSQVAIEQQALINRINENTGVSIEYMNTSDMYRQPLPLWNMFMSTSSNVQIDEDGRQWRVPLLPTDGVYVNRTCLMREFVAQTHADGVTEYIMLSGQSVVPYTKSSIKTNFSRNILGEAGRDDYTCEISVEDSESGAVVGFWGAEPFSFPMQSFTYRYTRNPGQMILTVRDGANWKWQYTLPGYTEFTTVALNWNMFTLSANQTGNLPSTPVPTNLTQCQIETLGDIPSSIETYCFNSPPPFYSGESYNHRFKLMINDHYEFVAKFGDIQLVNVLPLLTKYVPGLIPFSTNYSRTKGQKEYWRGTPNTGYQYPTLWVLGGKSEGWTNVIDYFYDAQQAFFDKKGVWGPPAPIFIWPRYDNLIYGDEMNSFSFYDWGSHTPWGGYYSRAFYSMCHLYVSMKDAGIAIPWKLTTCINRYVTYIADFMRSHEGLTPTVFPNEGLPYNDGYDPDPEISRPDHTAHMTGHWVSGSVQLIMNGFAHADLDYIIQECSKEFENTYVRTNDIEDLDMNGSFSPWVGGGMFYGFWIGEVMRGLSHIIMYQDWKTRPIIPVEVPVFTMRTENDANDIVTEDGLFYIVIANPVVDQTEYGHINIEDNSGSVETEDSVGADEYVTYVSLEKA